tara:strand:+ start:303 stop:614 length:312 start_codon:yes stop_codon:yes gene_type:complete
LFSRYKRARVVVVTSHHHRALFIFQFAKGRARPEKRERNARETKEEKEEKKKVAKKKVPPFVCRAVVKKVFSSRIRKYTRVERHIFSKDLIILPQNLSQRLRK